MLFDKDNPCHKGCVDRPNCKGCERGNAWRNKVIAEHNRKATEADFRQYRFDTYNKTMKKGERFKRGELK